MISHPLSRRTTTAVAALLAGAWLTPASAQVDFSIPTAEVIQNIQTGNTSLTAGRATMLRVSVRQNGGSGAEAIDGILRVFVDGLEADISPVFSDNGPFNVPANTNKAIEDHTLNFVFVPPAGDVTLTVEVNPSGPNFVPENNLANNERSFGPFDFVERGVPELAYAPIDYRPSGGSTPNPPDNNLIDPGVGDNFIQAVYPGKDWDYHRTDAPTKLWTQSLGGTGSSLLNSLSVDINMMVPKPDFLYGWVPGSLPYNGQAFISGEVSMGNTQPIRHQRTFAHELGHNTGLSHNNTTVNLIGVDVEHHLAITESLPKIKPTSQKDIMAAGLLTHQAWVAPGNYEGWMNDAEWAPPGAFAATPELLDEGLFIAGTWNRQTGAIAFTDVLTMTNVEPTVVTPTMPANLVLRSMADGDVLGSLPITIVTSSDCTVCVPEDDDGSGADAVSTPSPIVGFMAIVPTEVNGRTIDAFEVDGMSSARVLKRRVERSGSAPEASITVDMAGSLATLSWEAVDADGDALRSYLRYSPDGEMFTPVASGLDVLEYSVDMTTLARPVAGKAFFELFVTDGLDTTVIRTDALPTFAGGGGGNLPWTHILTPDNNLTFSFGATVVLHSSGWDIEDRALTGSSIQWSSNLDGALTSGRVTSTSSLSVGLHVVTVTAMDSDGNIATDTVNVNVVDRGLPGIDVLCQSDIGFGGPGSAVLALCGGDLSSGTSADLTITNATPLSSGFFAIGGTNNPTPFKGGMLVPVPLSQVVLFSTDANGELNVSGVSGGGGPVTIYVQAAIADVSQPLGFEISNAIEVEILP